MTRWETPAVTLSTSVRGESDLAVHLATPRQGRLWVLARGALRSYKRFPGAWGLASQTRAGLLIGARTGAPMVEHAELLESGSVFGQSPLFLARACVLIEMAKLTMPEQSPCEKQYVLLRDGLRRLAHSPGSDRWSLVYAYRMLGQAGYRPEFSCCLGCGSPGKDEGLRFSPQAGGMVCEKCLAIHRQAPGSGELITITPDTARSIEAMMDFPQDRLPVLGLSPGVMAQARTALSYFVAHHLGAVNHSLLFLARMESARTKRPGQHQRKC